MGSNDSEATWRPAACGAILAVFLLLFCTAPGAQAAEPAPDSLSGPVIARVYYADEADLARLARELDIWEVQRAEGYVLAMLTPVQARGLLQTGYRLEVDTARTATLNRPAVPLPGQTGGIPGYPCYRTVAETYQAPAHLADVYPNLVSRVDIGDSWDKLTPGGPAGYNLYALVLSNKASRADKARLFVMAEVHAREYATAELAMRFAEYLLGHYGNDADVTWLLDYTEVHIVPLANPDGRVFAEQGLYWRKNTNNTDGCDNSPYYGTDLNRNYDNHWGGSSVSPCDETYQGRAPASEPETAAIQRYLAALYAGGRRPPEGMLVSLHSYGPLVLYPWGWTYDLPPDEAALRTLGRKFGFYNNYPVQHDVDLYPTTGTTDDWAYAALGLPSYTFEVGWNFFEDCASFESNILPDNLAALLYAAKAARRPYENPAGPETLQVGVSITSVVAGTPVTLTALADDTRFGGRNQGGEPEPSQEITAARYTIDAPSWITGVVTYALSASDGHWDTPQELLRATVDTAALSPGRHLLFVESQDATGRWGVPGAVFLWVQPRERIHLPVVRR